MQQCKSGNNLDKYTDTEVFGLPTAEKLRSELLASENADIRAQLASLFDKDTFVETSAYAKRGFSDFLTAEGAREFEGVITGYGAIDGKLVFAFAEDSTRMGGAIDERHAKKITDLYALAMKNKAPVVGIFDSTGAEIFEGTGSLSAYGRIAGAVAHASGKIPQIAYVYGNCFGTAAAIASMFDITVRRNEAKLYVTSPDLTGVKNGQDSVLAFTGDDSQCAAFIRSLISFLPSCAGAGPIVNICADNLNRLLGDPEFSGDALAVISAISDNGVFYELGHDGNAITTSLAVIGGVRCGIIATSFAVGEGRIDAAGARKAARFVTFCDAYSIPVVTMVDSLGIATDAENERDGLAPALARLAFAYSVSVTPKVTVITGHAIGASFVLLGSKSLGAELVYATDNAEIGALNAEAGVAFAWDKYITLDTTREMLVTNWKENVSSPVAAAASGEIDDIISVNEMRCRICSALLMLSGTGDMTGGRGILPL